MQADFASGMSMGRERWAFFCHLRDVQEEEEDEEAQLRSLKGLKVKHGADELQEGETMILTLADKNILDDKGDLDEEEQDELENVLAVCHCTERPYSLLHVSGPSC